MEENVLVSHLDRIKENAWTHVVPLYPQQLCRILIEFGVIPQLITYYIGIQHASIFVAYLVFNVFYIDRVFKYKLPEII